MSRLLYNGLFLVAFIVYAPFYAVHLWSRGGLGWDFLQRFGLFGRVARGRLRALEGPVWVHAVSVGETVAALSFIRRLQSRWPGRSVVLSSTTSTGHALAEQKAPAGVVCIYCPLDFWPCVRRALSLVRPALLVIFEVEIWPNLILETAGRGVPVALVNGRMSDRSARGYWRWRGFFGRLFRSFRVIAVQTAADAERLRPLLDDTVRLAVCSTVKFDQVPDADGADKSALLSQVFGPGERLVLCVGSTHAGEEAMACDAMAALKAEFPTLKMVLVPRHHERTPEVEKVLRERGLSYRLLVPPPAPGEPVDVLVVNTTGELMNFYGACDVAYVGKSLAGNAGGHNIIEPAIFGKPILHGAAMQNFREVAGIFREASATVELADAADFAPALRGLLADPERRRDLGARARRVVDENRGAIERTLDLLEPLL
ncbi:MAG: 3-deoxy-D-manno-octulosonic acid transferase [Lentisphaerae bacterium]|nr:3-deoxy-D-manno-octulosonic acid transferase [Lentisphaerota bacterium]